MSETEIKPVSECESVAEVLATVNHLVKELNKIPGVKASMNIEESHIIKCTRAERENTNSH